MSEFPLNKIVSARNNDYIITESEGSIRYIIFNRPQKSNAFKAEMYVKLDQCVAEANKDRTIKFIVIVGNGKNFTTGNDLNNFTDPDFAQFPKNDVARYMAKTILQEMIKTIVTSNKPIFAIVQGMATGFGFTQLGLYDRVFAVEGAIFRAPLVKTAQGPEMCSSYTFPKYLGVTMTIDILIQGKQISVDDLAKKNFVTKVSSVQQGKVQLKNYLNMLNQLDYQSLIETRNLMRYFEKGKLLQVNELECRNLLERWLHPQLNNNLTKYLMNERKQKKAKL